MIWLVAALLVGFAWAAPALTPDQQAQAARIEQNLRCPVCAGESVYDSRSDISQSIRAEVAAQVVQGKSDAEVLAYFQRRFGDSILMRPPVRGLNLWLWGLPLVAVAAGGAWLFFFLRRSGPRHAPDLSPEEAARVEAELQARRGEG